MELQINVYYIPLYTLNEYYEAKIVILVNIHQIRKLILFDKILQ